MRSFSKIACTAMVLGLSATAGAAPHTHDGFYFGVTGGLGYYHASADQVTASGVTLPSFSMFIGGTAIEGLAIGGGFFVDYSSGWSVEQGGQSVDPAGAQMVIALGAFADYWLDPHRGGLHFQGFLGWGGLEETEGAGGSDPTGLTVMAGAGYDVWLTSEISVGGLARIAYGSYSLSGTDFTTLAPALLGTLTWH